ncbi:hypothetical protein B9Z55_025653 [Caenorhabditis nigoni]|nr:hypothetical protein B9Z55_025653 [Caenorhabditis nigoni]
MAQKTNCPVYDFNAVFDEFTELALLSFRSVALLSIPKKHTTMNWNERLGYLNEEMAKSKNDGMKEMEYTLDTLFEGHFRDPNMTPASISEWRKKAGQKCNAQAEKEHKQFWDRRIKKEKEAWTAEVEATKLDDLKSLVYNSPESLGIPHEDRKRMETNIAAQSAELQKAASAEIKEDVENQLQMARDILNQTSDLLSLTGLKCTGHCDKDDKQSINTLLGAMINDMFNGTNVHEIAALLSSSDVVEPEKVSGCHRK